MKVLVRQTRRLCGSKQLTLILSLGDQLLASVFQTQKKE